MGIRRVIGLTFGCALLAIALLFVVNALEIVTLFLVGTVPLKQTLFLQLTNLGAALVVGSGGYIVLQRVRQISAD
ncbi:hypothetical protein AUR64_14725 [Haloprofundus marisrubri]|uniref:Uncharacterized protein n=1 Tax=Haloprofundus marisrubri TaxID=1514971 RepID=A0A0W1R6K2_9EURY|nr:hypothetical protein [Haloprofundus marisrubri]KTG09053.1 hypothetical protein AUR64_14725 [Haloprofundus marisrubri]